MSERRIFEMKFKYLNEMSEMFILQIKLMQYE